MASAPARAKTPMHPLLLCLVGWLVPGLGMVFLGTRYRLRAIAFLVLVHLTFLIGLLLGGGVAPPVVEPGLLGMTAIGFLTFFMQLGAGWPALVSLLGHFAGIAALSGDQAGAYYELGAFYMLVAGTLNYFIVCHSYDLTKKPAFENLADS